MDKDKVIEVLIRLDGKEILSCKKFGRYDNGCTDLSDQYFQFPSGNIYHACRKHAERWVKGKFTSQGIKEITENYSG